MKTGIYNHAEATEKLQQKTIPFPCPYCGGNDFGVSDRLGMLLSSTNYSSVDTNKALSLVLLTCSTCGYTALFDANKLTR